MILIVSVSGTGLEFQNSSDRFSKYLEAGSVAEKRKSADEIVNGFKNVGFIYLEKHGIPDGVVQNAFTRVSTSAHHKVLVLHMAKLFSRLERRIFPITPRCEGEPLLVNKSWWLPKIATILVKSGVGRSSFQQGLCEDWT